MPSWYLPLPVFYLLVFVVKYPVLIAFYLLFYYTNLPAAYITL
jgi:hypothetical protein